MTNEQMFCLRWNNHSSNFLTIFEELYKTESLTDVMLVATDGPPVKCHRMVLAACSPYFHEMFLKNQQDPAYCLLLGVKYSEIKAILNFVYTGACNVKGEMIPRLIDVARDLKIKGLTEDTQLHSTKIEPEYVQSPPPPPARHPLPSASNSALTNGHVTPPVRSPTYHIPLYGQSPIDRYINTHALNAAFPGFVPLVQHGISGHQPPPRGQHSLSSSYDTSMDSSPLSRKKQLANREMPILRDVLARREEEAERQEQYSNGHASPHDSDRRNSAEFADNMAVEDDTTVNGVPASRGPRAERGRAANGKSGPEWKRYKQYTREDIQAAMTVVKDKKMSALQAARQYGVPSRTLYDKLKKAGILPSRGTNSRRESTSIASSCDNGSARFPYPGELNGTVYGNGRDAHSEGDSDTNNGPLNDSIYSAMMLHAAASRAREEQQSSDDMVVDMSTHSSPSPSSSRHRSDSMEDQVEDLSVNRVAADVAVISRAVSAVLEAAREAAVKEETEERPSPPAV